MNEKRFKETLDALNQFGYSNQGLNRTAFSEEEEYAKKHLAELFKAEGMTVMMDTFGNMIARREGGDPTLPAVACGSHIDTVYNGGKYDGTVGVVGGLEIIRFLNEEEITTEHPIEVIVFACEESARFGVATIGSKVMTGLIGKEDLVSLKDKQGISIAEAMIKTGYSLDDIGNAKREKAELKAFYEMHIEQGPVLESEDIQVGIVSGIAAPTRFKLNIVGEAAHSGSTPMHLRKDAFTAASEIALRLETVAREEAVNGTVATIGNCKIPSGAMNVIPGEVEVLVDIRSISTTSKEKVIKTLLCIVKKVENNRYIKVRVIELSDELPIEMDRNLVNSLKEISEKNGISYKVMPSGAGHDAMNMAKIYPTGMIFVPSKNGISHNKDEYTSIEQIIVGVTLLKEVILAEAHVIKKAYS